MYQVSCTFTGGAWQACAGRAPSYGAYNAAWQELSTDTLNISDQDAVNLALQYEGTATEAIGAPTPAAGEKAWFSMLQLEENLLARCGQLIQGQ